MSFHMPHAYHDDGWSVALRLPHGNMHAKNRIMYQRWILPFLARLEAAAAAHPLVVSIAV
jgi:hypothetical protein